MNCRIDFHRSAHLEQQDLDLLSEPLANINNRLSNTNHPRSASLLINKTFETSASSVISSVAPAPTIEYYPRYSSNFTDGRSRHNGPLAATSESIYRSPNNKEIHSTDVRSFQSIRTVPMKPTDDFINAHGRRRPCHRQNALRYKSTDQDPAEKLDESPWFNGSHLRNPSIERRVSSISTRKSASFDIHDEIRPADISWSVREKAKLFEHPTNIERQRFSTGRENYV